MDDDDDDADVDIDSDTAGAAADDDDGDDADDVDAEFCFSTLTSETTRTSETFAAHVCQRSLHTSSSQMQMPFASTEGGTFAATMVTVHLDELLAFEEFWKNSRGGVKSLHSSSRPLAALSAFAHSNFAFAHSSMHLRRQALAMSTMRHCVWCELAAG